MTQTLLTHVNIATMTPGGAPYGLMPETALAMENGVIRWIGPKDAVPEPYDRWNFEDLGGRLMTPGLVDCHTHLVYGGNRATEFEMRLNGATYEQVARAGGGIVSTVKATREASLDDLVQSALPRLDALIAEGVTMVEVKSGYGLDIETEIRMLKAARALQGLRDIRIKTSFLGAHATPPEFTDRKDAYIDEVCIPALEAVAAEGLADAVDGFCEGIAFDVPQIRRVFEAARKLGIPVKLHAEQLSNIGGTRLAAEFGALSADHIEYANAADAAALAASKTVAVILPGAFYTLRETQKPPVQAFRDHGVPMALATDCNPGSSPMTSLLLAMNMGCTLFSLTPEEALAGVTRNGARALGLDNTGQIAVGFCADLAVWDVEQPGELAYRIGYNPLFARYFGGRK